MSSSKSRGTLLNGIKQAVTPSRPKHGVSSPRHSTAGYFNPSITAFSTGESDKFKIEEERRSLKYLCCVWKQVSPFLTSESLGRSSKHMTCPNCLHPMKTRISAVTSKRTNIVAIALIPFCCCFFPYVTPFCRSIRHECPVCSVYIGTSK